MSITTDHSRATLAGAHSDGAIPNASRADRPTSFDPDDFAVPTGREENWRFSPVRQLKAMFANEGYALAKIAAWKLTQAIGREGKAGRIITLNPRASRRP